MKEKNIKQELIERLPAEVKPQFEQIILPYWHETTRGAPNPILRSALFAAIQGKTREYLKSVFIASFGDIKISFTGMQLDQSDLDVWEQAIHLARRDELGNVCYFRANSFLKAIGRSNSKTSYIWLKESIDRLIACSVEIESTSLNITYSGNLIHDCTKNHNTGIYSLTLNPKIIQLYSANNWTAIQWSQRMKLKRKPLALWLFGFYSTHAAPYPIKLETLRDLSGSKTKNLYNFKIAVQEAFTLLEEHAGMKVSFDKDDLVCVERLPAFINLAQQKHLNKITNKR